MICNIDKIKDLLGLYRWRLVEIVLLEMLVFLLGR